MKAIFCKIQKIDQARHCDKATDDISQRLSKLVRTQLTEVKDMKAYAKAIYRVRRKSFQIYPFFL